MGFDISSVPEIINIAQSWQTELLPTFLPYLPEVMNGKVSGLMAELGKLEIIFPDSYLGGLYGLDFLGDGTYSATR